MVEEVASVAAAIRVAAAHATVWACLGDFESSRQEATGPRIGTTDLRVRLSQAQYTHFLPELLTIQLPVWPVLGSPPAVNNFNVLLFLYFAYSPMSK